MSTGLITTDGFRQGGKTYRFADGIPAEALRKYMRVTSDAEVNEFTESRFSRTDPKFYNPNLPANAGQPIMPHALTFGATLNTLSRALRNPDEAVRNSKANAAMMRRDPMVMGPLLQRQMAVSLLPWEIVPEDTKDQKQLAAAQLLTKIVKSTPRLTEYMRCCLEAIWYGRYACQNVWGIKWIDGKRCNYVRQWQPINGDKLVFRQNDGSYLYDPDQWGIRVHATTPNRDFFNGAYKVEWTPEGPAIFLQGWERALFTLHKNYIIDGEFEDVYTAGMIHGVGLRHFLYWTWLMKQEALAQLSEAVERTAMGFTIYHFPAGNAQAENEMQTIANEQANKNQIVIPHDPSNPDAFRIEQIPPNNAGIQTLQQLIDDYFGNWVIRFILGQTLSMKADATGLGSGVADLHRDSFQQVIMYDSLNLGETMSRQLVDMCRDFNLPEFRNVEFNLQFNVQDTKVQELLEGYRAAYEMGCELRTEDIMGAIGAEIPSADDKSVKNPMYAQGIKELEMMDQQQQMAEQQAQAGPGMPGAPEGTEASPEDEMAALTEAYGPVLNMKPPAERKLYKLQSKKYEYSPGGDVDYLRLRYDVTDDEGRPHVRMKEDIGDVGGYVDGDQIEQTHGDHLDLTDDIRSEMVEASTSLSEMVAQATQEQPVAQDEIDTGLEDEDSTTVDDKPAEPAAVPVEQAPEKPKVEPRVAQAAGHLISGRVDPVDAEEYMAALARNPMAETLSAYEGDDLKGMSFHKLPDADIYWALKPYTNDEGQQEVDLVGVINNGGPGGYGAPAALLHAIENGATTLDAYAVTPSGRSEPILPSLYSRFGFETDWDAPFDPQYLPEGEAGKQKFAKLLQLWQDQGWEPEYNEKNEVINLPGVVGMRFAGGPNERRQARETYLRTGSVLQGRVALDGKRDEAIAGAFDRGLAGESDGLGEGGSGVAGGESLLSQSPTSGVHAARAHSGSGSATTPELNVRSSAPLRTIATLQGMSDQELQQLGVDPQEIREVRPMLKEMMDKPTTRPGSKERKLAEIWNETVNEKGGKSGLESMAMLKRAGADIGFKMPNKQTQPIDEFRSNTRQLKDTARQIRRRLVLDENAEVPESILNDKKAYRIDAADNVIAKLKEKGIETPPMPYGQVATDDELMTMALRGLFGKEWYQDSNKQILENLSAPDVKKFFAMTAAGGDMGPRENLMIAIKHTLREQAGAYGDNPADYADRIQNDVNEWKLLKTDSSKGTGAEIAASGLRGEQIPSTKLGDFQGSLETRRSMFPSDMWVIRQSTGADPNKGLDQAAYDYANGRLRHASRKMGFGDDGQGDMMFQAAAWVGYKQQLADWVEQIYKQGQEAGINVSPLRTALERIREGGDFGDWMESLGMGTKDTGFEIPHIPGIDAAAKALPDLRAIQEAGGLEKKTLNVEGKKKPKTIIVPNQKVIEQYVEQNPEFGDTAVKLMDFNTIDTTGSMQTPTGWHKGANKDLGQGGKAIAYYAAMKHLGKKATPLKIKETGEVVLPSQKQWRAIKGEPTKSRNFMYSMANATKYAAADDRLGEWWLQGGSAEYADGDVGDSHESIVSRDLRNQMAEVHGLDDVDTNWEDWQKLTRAGLTQEMRDAGFTDDHWDMSNLVGDKDPREHAAREWGWTRLAENEMQTAGLNSGKLRSIAADLYDVLGDRYEDSDLDNSVWNIEDIDGHYHTNVPFHVLEAGDMKALRDYRQHNTKRYAMGEEQPAYVDDPMQAHENQGITFDANGGAGSWGNGPDTEYFGWTTMMEPETFLNLNPERLDGHVGIKEHMEGGGSIAPPHLSIQLNDDGEWEVVGHEGRGRMLTMQEMDKHERVPVTIHPMHKRARDFTPEDILGMTIKHDPRQNSGFTHTFDNAHHQGKWHTAETKKYAAETDAPGVDPMPAEAGIEAEAGPIPPAPQGASNIPLPSYGAMGTTGPRRQDQAYADLMKYAEEEEPSQTGMAERGITDATYNDPRPPAQPAEPTPTAPTPSFEIMSEAPELEGMSQDRLLGARIPGFEHLHESSEPLQAPVDALGEGSDLREEVKPLPRQQESVPVEQEGPALINPSDVMDPEAGERIAGFEPEADVLGEQSDEGDLTTPEPDIEAAAEMEASEGQPDASAWTSRVADMPVGSQVGDFTKVRGTSESGGSTWQSSDGSVNRTDDELRRELGDEVVGQAVKDHIGKGVAEWRGKHAVSKLFGHKPGLLDTLSADDKAEIDRYLIGTADQLGLDMTDQPDPTSKAAKAHDYLSGKADELEELVKTAGEAGFAGRGQNLWETGSKAVDWIYDQAIANGWRDTDPSKSPLVQAPEAAAFLSQQTGSPMSGIIDQLGGKAGIASIVGALLVTWALNNLMTRGR